MMIFAVALVVILTTLLTWWGYRCGAVTLLCREVIVLFVIVVAYLGWYASGSVVMGLIVAAATGVVLPRCIAAFRRCKTSRTSGRATDDPPMSQWRWLRRCDRLVGAGLGLIGANACCYGLAIAGASLAFSMSVDRLYADEYSDQHAESQWVAYVGEASQALGWLSEFGLLNQIPQVKEYRKEISAVITLLNAPPDKIKWLVEKRELMAFYDLPPVQAAIDDPSYLQRIERARGGDVAAILDLTRDEHTHNILRYPQVRALAQDVTPSQLLAELDAIPDDADFEFPVEDFTNLPIH